MTTPRTHEYEIQIGWEGNRGEGTVNYGAYSRDHRITGVGKPPVPGSSDPAFRGDAGRYNPEELFVASLSACHMLWYLHLCADNGLVVTSYRDAARGTMVEGGEEGGRFTEVTLHPVIDILGPGDGALARDLHEEAHRLCFIANSVNFPVRCEPEIRILAGSLAEH